MPATVLLLANDLLFGSRARGAAQRLGVVLAQISTPAAIVERCTAGPIDLVIVDLSLGVVEIADLVSNLRVLTPAPRRIIAYGPHVHAAQLQAAADAGCDAVLSRGEFNARMDDILAAAGT